LRLLDVDPLSGTRTYHHYDPLTKQTTIKTVGDAEPGLEWAKALAKEGDYWKQGVKNGRAHYAHIPNDVLLKWHSMGVNIGDPKALIEMVNKPEWKYLKTTDKVHVAKG
jgi:hypothetical protein